MKADEMNIVCLPSGMQVWESYQCGLGSSNRSTTELY